MSAEGFQAWLDREWPNGAATGVEYDIDDLEAAYNAGRERRWRCTADPANVPCGKCVPCRQDHADAYAEGRADGCKHVRRQRDDVLRAFALATADPSITLEAGDRIRRVFGLELGGLLDGAS